MVAGTNAGDGGQNYGTTGLRNHGSTGLQDCETTRPRDYGGKETDWLRSTAILRQGYNEAGRLEMLQANTPPPQTVARVCRLTNKLWGTFPPAASTEAPGSLTTELSAWKRISVVRGCAGSLPPIRRTSLVSRSATSRTVPSGARLARFTAAPRRSQRTWSAMRVGAISGGSVCRLTKRTTAGTCFGSSRMVCSFLILSSLSHLDECVGAC